MRPIQAIVLLVAVVAAGGLFMMMRNMASGPKPTTVIAAPAPVEKPVAQVLVAKRDLPVGTRITAADVGWQPWPLDALNPSFITDGSAPAAPPPPPKDAAGKAVAKADQAVKAAASMISGSGAMQRVAGAVVREPILSGEPVTERKIVRGGEGGFMAVVLQPGMRAMALPVTVETGAGGFILPGDRVDVLQNRRVEGAAGGASNQETVASVIMRNLRVLAIDQTTEPQKDAKAMVGAVATLEVPASDEEVVSRAKSQGDLVLALRSYADAGGPSGRGAGGENSRIRVWRAGQASEVTVSQ
jgi:pilus assembly protein CpaB